MKLGIVPGWLLAAAVAYGVGGVPGDLCAAGAAIGIGLSLVVVMRSSAPFSTTLLPIMALLMRYVFLPTLSATGSGEASQVEHVAHILASSPALVVISALSITVAYLIGIKWAYTGEP